MTSYWRPTKLSRAQMYERRHEGQRLLETQQYTMKQIAQILGVHDSTVRHWAKKLRDFGDHALEMRRSSGRSKRLTAE